MYIVGIHREVCSRLQQGFLRHFRVNRKIRIPTSRSTQAIFELFLQDYRERRPLM